MDRVTNRDGQTLELGTIEKVEESGDGYAITKKDGWTFFVYKDECGDFVPREGDYILISMQGFNTIAGINIEGRVIRAKTKAQCEQDHKTMVDGFRLKKLEEYVAHGDELKKRVKKLHPVLEARMNRFAEKDGVEFWVDSAGYEMAVMEGANALLNKVADELGFDSLSPEWLSDHPAYVEAAVEWINDWWDINSDKHDPPYDYKKQMEIVPDFGDGHSGYTASAAKSVAIYVLKGENV